MPNLNTFHTQKLLKVILKFLHVNSFFLGGGDKNHCVAAPRMSPEDGNSKLLLNTLYLRSSEKGPHCSEEACDMACEHLLANSSHKEQHK